jgi:hypothetical protein
MRDLRILCLHGYHGSAQILRRQMASLADSLNGVELIYLDAPSLAAGDFGWWHTSSEGWERTRAWAHGVFAAQASVDGVFGFSQGAAFAGLLAAMRQGPADDAIRFDFAVMVGGFKADVAELAALYRHKLALPSVHIIGRTDSVIRPRESQALADLFEDPLVLTHAGGHIVPDDRAVVAGLVDFLERTSRR